jgi:hypothetical protein
VTLLSLYAAPYRLGAIPPLPSSFSTVAEHRIDVASSIGHEFLRLLLIRLLVVDSSALLRDVDPSVSLFASSSVFVPCCFLIVAALEVTSIERRDILAQ